MVKTSSLLILFLSVFVLSACSGWHLRGSDSDVDVQQKIYLEGESGQVYTRLQRALEKKAALTDIASANIQLVLGKEYSDRRTITIDNNANTRQYQLTLAVTYELLDNTGKPLTEKTTAEITRYYTFNQNAINTSDKEEQSLRRDMVRQLARQILQRVGFLSKTISANQ